MTTAKFLGNLMPEMGILVFFVIEKYQRAN
jgi:hypothetical protein